MIRLNALPRRFLSSSFFLSFTRPCFKPDFKRSLYTNRFRIKKQSNNDTVFVSKTSITSSTSFARRYKISSRYLPCINQVQTNFLVRS